MSTAVIDIGTNTLLLLIVDDALKRIVDLCRFGRLGKGLDASGRLAAESIANSLEICREYRRVMDQHGIAAPRVIGTQALRVATNAAEFVTPAEQILGAPIEVITGKREAELACLAVDRTFPELEHVPHVVIDVGGGSSEVIAIDGAGNYMLVSLPIGAVVLTERCEIGDPPDDLELDVLARTIDPYLAPLELPHGAPIIATAGTATTMAALHLALTTYDPDAVTGLRLSRADVDAQLTRLARLTIAERRTLPGMVAERADVILAGIAILSRVMHRMAAPVMITCDRGIRWGIAYERRGQ